MQFVFSESSKKDIAKLPTAEQKRLKKKLLYWQQLNNPLVQAKSLTRHQSASHRFRFGSYRLIVKVLGDEIRVLRVRHRKDIYKR